MKRKLAMTVTIIVAVTSLIACDQETVDQAIEQANSQGVEITNDEVNEIISSFEEEATLDEEEPAPDEEESILEEEDATPEEEPAPIMEEEPEIIYTPAPTEGGKDEELTLVPVSPTVEIEEGTSLVIDVDGNATIVPEYDPNKPVTLPTDTPVPSPSPAPTDIYPEYPVANVNYNLTLLEGENTTLDTVTVSMQLIQPLEENTVPASNGWYVPSEIVTKEIASPNEVNTFSIEDWRTTGRERYDTQIIINFGRPFTVTTATVGRIPSVNGVVTVWLSELDIVDNGGEVDIVLTLNDETGMW